MKLRNYNKIISANWKMNGSLSLVKDFQRYIYEEFNKVSKETALIICPPYTFLNMFREVSRDFENIFIGAQDCSINHNISLTGDISASILKNLDCHFVILGHSERRLHYGETNEIVSKKIEQVIKNDLNTIVCIGETEEEKNKLITNKIVQKQIEESLNEYNSPHNTIIAYEPIWAIGTGKVPILDEILIVNNYIHQTLKLKYKLDNNKQFKILYGGSVKPDNSKTILSSSEVDGALVGGSSLIIEDFKKIVNFNEN